MEKYSTLLEVKQDHQFLQETLPAHLQALSPILSGTLTCACSVLIQTYLFTLAIHNMRTSPPQVQAGLGMSLLLFHNLLGSFITGCNIGFTSIAGRAYGSQAKFVFQRTFHRHILVQLILIPILIFLFYIGQQILLLLGQQKEVAKNAQQIGILLLPGFISFLISDFIRCVQMSTQVYTPYTIISFLTLCFASLLCLILSQVQYYGPILILDLSFIFMLILSIFSLKICPWGDCLTLPNKASLQVKSLWDHCLQVIGVSGFKVLSLMCFEMSTFFVGGIQDAVQLAAQLALVNLANVICSFSMGLSNTVVSVISNQIGQSRPLAVQNTIIYACCLIVVIYTTLTVLFLIQPVQNTIISFYSQNEKVQSFAIGGLIIYSSILVFDTLQYQGCFILKALGESNFVIKISLLIDYGIGLPLSWIILKYINDLKGVWIGYGIGAMIMFILISKKIYNIDIRSAIQKRRQQIILKL